MLTGEEVVLQLVSKGANKEARDEDGRTALFLTTMAGHVSMLEILIGTTLLTLLA
jgi:hypothetical protein